MAALDFLLDFRTREGEPLVLKEKWYILAVWCPPFLQTLMD
jgi:hypothetical protein